MIGQGQNKTRIFTRKKGWVRPRTADPEKKAEGKREREKSGGEKGRKRKNEGETEVVGV
jgi:hypothetical protein